MNTYYMLNIMLNVLHSKMGKMVIKFKEFSLVVEQIGDTSLTRVRKRPNPGGR